MKSIQVGKVWGDNGGAVEVRIAGATMQIIVTRGSRRACVTLPAEHAGYFTEHVISAHLDVLHMEEILYPRIQEKQ